MKKLFLSLGILVLLVVMLITYLGFMPVLSPILAKPMDLGIKTDQSLADAIGGPYGLKNNLPGGVAQPGIEPQYSGSVPVTVSLSSQEITTIVDSWASYPASPISDVQIRINPDGSGEMSGMLKISAAVDMGRQLGYSDEQIEAARQWAKFMADEVPFYAQARGEVSDNQVQIEPAKAQLGNITLPKALMGQVAGAVADAIGRRIDQVPGAYVESLTLDEGKVNFQGTVPEVVE